MGWSHPFSVPGGKALFELETLRDYEARKLIKSSRSEDGYTVWCYTQSAVYDRAWDDVTRACRGLIMSPSGDLIARPFPKFHNYGEPEAQIEDGPFVAFDKMDGTLIVVGNDGGRAVTSTKGSFATWHSAAARELLYGFVPPEGTTALFEFIHPKNRIVVDYGDYEGLVLLGLVDNETGADVGFPEVVGEEVGWHGDIVTQRKFHLPNMLNTMADPEAGENREGFVVVWQHQDRPWNRVKLKFAQYVTLHRAMTGLTTKRIWETMVDGTFDVLLDSIPDEMYPEVQAAASEISAKATRLMGEAALLVAGAQEYESRREVAQYFMENAQRSVAGLAFKLYDDKPYADVLRDAYRMSRPDESTPLGSFRLQGS